jgi:hypothetical protein
MLRGEEYLLTNEHVAREIQGQPLAHQPAKEEFATRISNPFQAAPAPYDLALTRINQAFWSDLKNQRLALSIQRLALKHEPVEHEFLFTIGYSGERSYFSPTFATLFARATPYLTQPANMEPPGLSHMWFAMPYSPERAQSLDPKAKGLPDPHGFSGAPVWDTKFRRCNLESRPWRAEESEITGIVFCWLPSTAQILAIRVEYVREFLLMALRKQSAYFHWLDRGAPYDDALTDWLWAEGAVPSLSESYSTAIHEAAHAMFFDAVGIPLLRVSVACDELLEGCVKTAMELQTWAGVPGTLAGPAASFYICNEVADRDLSGFPTDRKMLIELRLRDNPEETHEVYWRRVRGLLEGWVRSWVTAQKDSICRLAGTLETHKTLEGQTLSEALKHAWACDKPDISKLVDEVKAIVNQALTEVSS